MKALLLLLAVLILVGCTATPEQKLSEANDNQLHNPNRSYAEERLLREAMEGFASKHDYHGLGNAQFAYGYFLQSDGFRTTSIFREMYPNLITAEDINRESERYLKASAESFETELKSFSSSSDYWSLSNTYFLLARSHAQLHDLSAACPDFQKSLEYHNKAHEMNPKLNYYISPGYTDFDDMISKIKAKVGCPATRNSE